MPDTRKPQSDTLSRVAEEMLGIKLRDADQKPVADLLGNLSAEMQRMRDLLIGAAEPVTIYRPEGK